MENNNAILFILYAFLKHELNTWKAKSFLLEYIF